MKHIQDIDTTEVCTVAVRSSIASSKKLPNFIDIVYFLLPFGAISLWISALHHVDVREMNDLGLISVLPPVNILALIILIVSFCLTLRQPRLRVPLLALHLVLLIFMLYGIENIIEEAVRFSIVYRHAGYTEYIMRTGSVNPSLDAYFSWPGFFVLSAFITQVAGYHSILSFAGWAPVFYNLIYFGPLYILFTTATTDKRLVWLGLLLFYLTNWIGQDYFSPQGLNFFLYLVITAILLKWFKIIWTYKPRLRRQSWQRSRALSLFFYKCYEWLTATDILHSSTQPFQQVGLLIILLLIFALVVFSHPLTPFFLLASVTSLVIFRRCYPFWLPILMAMMTGGWIFFMTQTFLAGHSSMVLGNIGQVSTSITSNVTNRVVQGNPEHTFIAAMRVIMTGAIWGLACIGGIRRLRKGRCDITYILPAIAPFPLIVTQDYGGEMFLRIYLFTLPLMVFFAAALFYSTHSLSIRGTSRWTTAAMICTCLVFLTGFLFTRYGNERMDYMTYAEVDGVQHLYHIAQPHSLFIEGWNDTPWQYQDYEKYSCYSLADILPDVPINGNVEAIVRFIESQNRPHTYMIFTRSQQAQAYSLAGLPFGSLNRLENKLIKSGQFKLIYTNPDVQIYLYFGKG